MEFSQTTLGVEFDAITRQGSRRYYSYEATLVNSQGEVPIMSVISIDWIRDYRKAAGDEVLLRVALPLGQYLNRVLPYKENLKLTLTRTANDFNGSPTSDSNLEKTYDAFIQVDDETATLGSQPATHNEENADLVGLKQVTLQLQDQAFGQLRSEMVGGSFRDCRPFDVLMALLNHSRQQQSLDLNERVLGIKAIPPNNQVKRSSLILTHGTPLVSVAEKLQTQHGGIYTAGIGCYLQQGYWYVWPLHDYTRFDQAQKTALFILAPSTQRRGIENTYRLVDQHLSVTITGGVQRLDPSEVLLLNEGNGTRFANVDTLLEGFVEVQGNRAVAKRTNNANEYEAIRRQGQSMSRVVSNPLHTNAFHEASKLTERNGAYISMNWENSDPDLIEPGLQCEVGFMLEDVPCFVNGVVVHVHGYSALSGTGLHQKIHQLTTQVVVMVDRHNPAYQRYLSQQTTS